MMKILFPLLLALTLQLSLRANDNPGYLDDPACRALITAQMEAQGVDLSEYEIKYDSSVVMPDGLGAVNVYHLVNKNGTIWKVVIGVHSEKIDGTHA